MNNILKNTKRIFNNSDGALTAAVSILSNNVYKVTYYEIITGAGGTLTIPTGATINAGEFAGANCILSEIDGSNKPTYITPLDGGGMPVTATLNVGTGAWIKSAPTVSVNVALIYSLNIAAINYQNLNNFYIIEDVLLAQINVGTTTITSGTNTRILYNNAGVVGEYLVTGTGTTAVLSTSPVFGTDITTPLIIGGTAVGSVIQYKGTSGNGTSTVAAHQFLVGNNGATTAMSIYNSGQVLFNGSTLPGGSLSQVRITKGTGIIDIGEWASGRGGIWFNLATPTVSNFHVGANTTGTDGYLNGSAASRLLANGNIIVSAFPTQVTFLPSAATGSTINFDFTTPNNTSRTASTNVSNFIVRGGTTTFNPGALATQYFNYFSDNTLAFGTASTATLAANFVAGYVQGGTNATVTTSAAIYVPTLALTNTTTAYGIYANAATGATTNWAAGFNGDVRINGKTTLIDEMYLGASAVYGIWSWNAGGMILRSGASAVNITLGTPAYTTNFVSYDATGNVAIGGVADNTTDQLQVSNHIGTPVLNLRGRSGAAPTQLNFVPFDATNSIITFKNTSGTTRGFIDLNISSGEMKFWGSSGGYFPTFGSNGSERMRIDTSGNIICNTAAIATTATDGFLYVSSCAGVPTGVPTAHAGRIPIVADSTNNKLYIYSGGAWVALN